jgi:anti-anti-sigma factor
MEIADLTLESLNGVVHAAVKGDIDLSNAKELRQQIREAMSIEALGVILDLSGVRYLDSAGIHFIHSLREDLRARGQRIELVIPDGSPILDTLRLAGLDWGRAASRSVEDAHRTLEPGRT